jgi:hypothetical protein
MAGSIFGRMRIRLLALVAIICCLVTSSKAQTMPGAGPGNIAFLRIFEQYKGLSATADMKISDSGAKDSMSVVFGLSLADGNARFDVDLANAKGSMISPEVVAQMKAVGMDRVVSIMRMDKKRLYIIYPGLKAYADMVIPNEAADSLNKTLKTTKTVQGKENVGSHSCNKVLLTVSDDKGHKQVITTWEAADMKSFPVQAQMMENGQNILVNFRDVKLSKPDGKVFEPPAGYKKYDDVQSMMAQGVSGK